eukprot:6985224-Alexandrium_andersonii.AAC.1
MPSLPGPTSTSVGPAGIPGSSSASSSPPSLPCPAASLVLGLPAGRITAAPSAPGASTEAR